jgi:hypothetical protein
MDEFHVCTFSNGNTYKYTKNTLTNFSNDLPNIINLPYNENWQVCVQSIGFSTNFHEVLKPKNPNIPSIKIFSAKIIGGDKDTRPSVILQTYEKNDIYKFKHPTYINDLVCELDLLLPSENMNITDVKDVILYFETINFLGVGLHFSVLKDCYALINYIDKSNTTYYVLLSEYVTKSFGFSTDSVEKVSYIDNEKYYIFSISNKNESIYGELKRWYNKYPDFIRVQCEQIKEQIYNSKISKDLIIFSPTFNSNEDYYYHEFLTQQYVPIENTQLCKLTISLLDERHNYLSLIGGAATFVKLKFKKMISSPDSFNVRLNSEKQDNNNFEIDLPQPYYLDSNWKVALTDINYPNLFRPLPAESRYRKIYSGVLGTLTYKSFEIPNKMYTVQGILDVINHFLNGSNGLSVQSTEETVNGISRLKVKVTVNANSIFTISRAIAELLGYESRSDSVIGIVDKKEFVSFHNILSGEEYRVFNFDGFSNINALNPNYLMIYTDIIEPNIVGSTYSKLLKIAPVLQSSLDNYKIEEFKHREFHQLESTRIKTIKISIRSHSGYLINFPESKRVFLNLLFSK